MVTDSRAGEKRWSWWSQARDVIATGVGLALVGAAIYRDSYNLTAMVIALACLGVVSSGVLSRYLIGRWGDRET